MLRRLSAWLRPSAAEVRVDTAGLGGEQLMTVLACDVDMPSLLQLVLVGLGDSLMAERGRGILAELEAET